MQINERFIKIPSRLPYPSDIELGGDLTVTNNGENYFSSVKLDQLDKQDSNIDVVYTLKSLIE